MESCELEILIATFGEEGLKRIAKVIGSPADGVRYIISCQCPGHTSLPIPSELIREDISIIFTPTKGLSVNRNNALRHASAPICLLADDDISYTPEAFSYILSIFHSHSDLNIATFRYTGSDGKAEKMYPSHSISLTERVKGYYLSAVEIAFRRASVIATGIGFNEQFGLGAPQFGSGEDELWIADLLKAGLHGRFFPFTIAHHPLSASTGLRLMADPKVLRAQGAIIKRFYSYTALLRIALKAYRSSKASHTSISKCFLPLLNGWWQATIRPRKLFHSKLL